MQNLMKKNTNGIIVPAKCHLSECPAWSNCADCAFIAKEDIDEIFEKLYKYEQTGLVFKEEQNEKD
jgi:hypothetical protein